MDYQSAKHQTTAVERSPMEDAPPFAAPEAAAVKEPWYCRGCPPNQPVRLQQVSYGHVKNGQFVVDEQTALACIYCHTVYTKTEIKI